MKAITATVSFTIKNRFYKEDLDEQLESYKEEIEALLDYDCDVYNPIKEEDTDAEYNNVMRELEKEVNAAMGKGDK